MKAAQFTAFGESKTLREWSVDPRCVVEFETLRRRVGCRGFDLETALTQPHGQHGPKPGKKKGKSHVNIGPLSKGGEGRHQVHAKVVLDVPTRLTNSSSKHPYVPPTWNVRGGADQHLSYRSLT